MREIVFVHSSDLHLGTHPDNSLASLLAVLRTARTLAADLVLLAGDVFDHNRLPKDLLEKAADLIESAALPVVILPGNHDPLTQNSVYRRGRLGVLPKVAIIGLTAEQTVVLPHLDLSVWGRPHISYEDMAPLEDPSPRQTHWQIAMAHGHWMASPADHGRAWLLTSEEIAATGADYVALGHWDLAFRAGNGHVPAYYSGSPSFAKTINLVRFSSTADALVDVVPL
ncbi:MAG: DNA repair exonuclease [Chloroflexi bacterium]|nr:DNA repair exonuclease [Chloroflexota bacterium]